jgi:hypothetical protein
VPMNAHLRKIHHKPFDAMFTANLRMNAFRVSGNSLLQCVPAVCNSSYGKLHDKLTFFSCFVLNIF